MNIYYQNMFLFNFLLKIRYKKNGICFYHITNIFVFICLIHFTSNYLYVRVSARIFFKNIALQNTENY